VASKYIQVKEHIKELINSGQLTSGQKISTENEIVKEFNVSRQTVRHAIGDLVNEGWLYRVQGRGTFVVQSKPKEPKNHVIGLVSTYFGGYQIWPSIIAGVDSLLSTKGFSIVVAQSNNKIEDEARCLNNLLKKDIDGLIIEPSKSALPNPNISLYKEFIKKGIPLVFINGYCSDLNASYVIEDDELGGYLATKHLLEFGHKVIGGIFKVDDVQGHGRYKGYLKAYREKGIEIPEDAITWFTTEDYVEIWKANGNQDSQFSNIYNNFLLKRIENCTALVCYNDWVALKVISLLRMRNIKVPNDISIVSFDDTEITKVLEFGLTNVPYPSTEIGEKAAAALISLMEDTHRVHREIIAPKLIVRNSTRKV